MQKHSCSIKVVDVQPQDFGATATVEFAQPSVGIDVSPEGPVSIHFTGDAADLFKPGSELILTISDEQP